MFGPSPGLVGEIRNTKSVTIFTNPPLANNGGFFIFPLLSGQPAKQPMENNNNEEPNPAPRPPRPEGLRGVSLLRDIYLEAGLGTEAALRSALADYTCYYLPMEVECAA